MALDEPKDEDSVFEKDGVRFVLDTQTSDVLNQSGGLTIDYVDEEYRRGYMLKLGSAGDCSTGGCNGCG